MASEVFFGRIGLATLVADKLLEPRVRVDVADQVALLGEGLITVEEGASVRLLARMNAQVLHKLSKVGHGDAAWVA